METRAVALRAREALDEGNEMPLDFNSSAVQIATKAELLIPWVVQEHPNPHQAKEFTLIAFLKY